MAEAASGPELSRFSVGHTFVEVRAWNTTHPCNTSTTRLGVPSDGCLDQAISAGLHKTTAVNTRPHMSL